MCNLYSLNKRRDMVARFFRVSHNRAVMFEPMAAIFPKHRAPVVRQAADGERELVLMSWGFMLLQNGPAPRPVTNVRDDKTLTSAFWKSSFEERRCLVGLFLLRAQRRREASNLALVLDQGIRSATALCVPRHPAPVQGPIKKDSPNVDIETYAFLTTTPNSLVSTINHQRMPVEEFETWLSGSPNEAFALAREYPLELMRIVQEGFGKEDLGATAIERASQGLLY